MKAKTDLLADLRHKGFRLTPQREKVIDIFYDLPAGKHLSAEDVYQLLRDEQTDISLATSYRTLKLLASVDVLREVDFSEDHKQYELARDEDHPHHHIICVDCGSTEEFESDSILAEAKQTAQQHHFELVDVELKVFARCLPSRNCVYKEASLTAN